MLRFPLRKSTRGIRSTSGASLRPRTRLLVQCLEAREVPALLTVTDSGDIGANTLRGIIGTANTNGEADTIQFSGVTTVTLTSGQITVSEAQGLLIDGGAGVTINSTAASAATSRIFTITATGKPAIGFSNLTLSGGKLSTGVGGAVLFTDQPVTLTNCTVTNNTASAGAGGAFGTVTAAANLTVNSSTFSGNSASGTGGAISMGGTSTVTINNSTFSKNSATGNGGGLAMVGVAVATITFTNFDGNASSASGGGVHGNSTTTLTIADCVFQNNKSLTGGALRTAGTIVTMTLDRTLVTGNTATSTLGGGFYMGNGGTVTINSSTFSNNTANTSGGGIRLSTHTSLIQNSTFSGNVSNATTSTTGGGGIVVTGAGNHTINNSTITNNSVPNATAKGGGWFSTVSTGTITFNSTIVAGNSNANQSDVSSGGTLPRNIGGNDNLIGALDTAVITLTGTNDPALLGTQATPVDAKLAPLANYGGPMPTHALLAGSPALDKGNNVPAFSFDQRGTGFPRVLNGTADVGAFEGELKIPTAKATLVNVTTAGGTTYQAIVDYSDETAINVGSIDLNDVTISGGFGSPISVMTSGAGTLVTATYTFNAPGGTFDQGDNGTYTLTMVPNQVFDTDGPAPVTAGSLGTFAVAIPATYTVDIDTDEDDGNTSAGDLSLREAIKLSNATLGVADIILFDAGLNGKTLTLSLGELSIADPLTITGNGSANTTISGNSASRIFNFAITGAGTESKLTGMTLTKGSTTVNGGAIIMADDAVTLTNMIITQNTATTSGGGVSMTTGTLKVIDSTISNNQATSTGGGITMTTGSTTITRSTVSGNTATTTGGGVYMSSGTLVIVDSTFSKNTANSATTGGGALSGTTAKVTITNSTLSGNNAPNGTAIGGAIRGTSSMTLTMDNSTVTGNSANGAGGGALGFSGTTAASLPIVNVKSSIIAQNFNAAHPEVFTAATTVTLTVNVDDSIIGEDGGLVSINGANNQIGTVGAAVDALLSSLGNYGGPTQTHGLLPLSPALDKGSNGLTLGFDQRGSGFPRVLNAIADIGATEGELKIPSAKATLANVTTAGGTTYVATVVYTDNTGINVGSIDINDVTISGGFGSPISVGTSGSGTMVTATYTFTPPGGSFDQGDNGTYTLTMVGNQVFDTDGPNPVLPGSLGTFNVAIPATYIVDIDVDEDDGNTSAGDLSLREAIKLSNTSIGATDTVLFDAGLSGKTLTLTLGVITVSDPVIVTGLGAANLTISGNSVSRIFNIAITGAGGKVELSGVTLADGNATTGTGGAIALTDEELVLNDTVFKGSKITGTGAAIGATTAGAILTISNSTFMGNSASSTGGAINLASSATVTLNKAVFDANISGSSGGAIQGSSTVVLNASDSTFSNNTGTSGGALRFASIAATSITLNRCLVTGNIGSGLGGGIYMSTAGNLTINESTFSTNTGAGGGAIRVNGVTTIISNSTLSGNTSTGTAATTGGGAFLNAGTPSLTIQNSTITKNVSANATSKGGGLFISSAAGTVTINSTIVADNSNPNQRDISASALRNVDGNNNLFGAVDPALITLTGTNPSVGTEATPIDPVLGPLASNGGPTTTHVLLSGSPAFDAGDNNGGLTFDQRGTGFPRVLNGIADIGSVETVTVIPAAKATSPNVPPINASQIVTVVYTDETGINTGGIGLGNIRLTAAAYPVPEAPTAFNITIGMNGDKSVTVEYTFTPPGGAWDWTDNGTYTVQMQANQVFDTDAVPNAVLAGPRGNFAVNIMLPAVLVVDKVGDVNDGIFATGQLTLREAIALTNAEVGNNVINFASSLNGMPIIISNGEMIVSDVVDIVGNGSANTLIQGSGTSRLFNMTYVGTSTIGMVAISSFAVTGGGGAIIMNSSSLTINSSKFTGNAASTIGGVINLGAATLTLTDCDFTNNSAGSTGGGAIGTGTGTIDVLRSTFDANLSASAAGAIFVNGAGVLTLVDSTVSNNVAGGTTGGAITTTSGTITITNSTISGNNASNPSAVGGGIRITGASNLTINNSTITNNTAGAGGGGIGLTVATATVTLSSTIVAQNVHATQPDLFTSTATASTVTIIDCILGVANDADITLSQTGGLVGTIGSPIDAMLNSLSSNGGSTMTHTLVNGSPALDIGNNNLTLSLDQRGTGFPRTVNGITDIGATEGVDVIPGAKATAPNVPPINATQIVTVVYTDETGINTGGIDVNDIRLTGGNYGAPEAPTAFKITAGMNGDKSVTVEYTFTPPGGAWDGLDNGKYTVVMQANQVFDTDAVPNAVNTGPKGSFLVGVPLDPLVVDNGGDTDDGNYTAGQLTLREAVKLANDSVASNDTISFAAALNGTTITLGSEIAINDPLTLNGPGASLLTISGSTTRLFNTLAAAGGSAISISGLTLTGGKSTTGSAIQMGSQNVTITNCVITGNSGTSTGGALTMAAGTGFLTLRSSTISNNTSTAGGGVTMLTGTSLLVESCLFLNNVTSSGNAGGGLRFAGTVGTNGYNVLNSTFKGNSTTFNGGGIGFGDSFVGIANIRNCTITGNTVSGTGGGGGIGANNTAGSSGTINIDSCIIFGNSLTGTGTGPDIFNGATASLQINANFSLIGTSAGIANFTPDPTTTSLIGQDPLLDVLASNGGPTQTMALKAGSPALNVGSNPAALAFDQRGTGFSRTSGSGTDIGAFEVQAVTAQVNGVAINSKLLTPVDKAQRSYVSDVAITFNSIVTFTGTPESAFTLDKVGGGVVTLSANVDNSGPGTVVTLTFTGGSVNATSLADGRYALHVLSAGITGGLNGGDFIFDEPAPPTALDTSKIFRIFGDYTGDGTVAANDFIQFRLALGNSSPPFQLFDFDNDGAVAASDFIQFRLRFGGSI